MVMTFSQIDKIDRLLIDELVSNARCPYHVMARKAGVSIATARKRVQHLLHEDIIRLELIPDPIKLGYQTVAFIGLNIQLPKLANIVRELQSKSPVIYLSITTGRFDIMLLALFKSPTHLASFKEVDLACVDGIELSETMIAIKIVKRPWVQLQNSPENETGIDVLDSCIIDALRNDVRAPVASLAQKLHISVPTIRRRIKRLERDGVIAISAICNQRKLGYQTAAYIGLRVRLAKMHNIERELAANPSVHYLTQIAGPYDIMLWTIFHSNNDLSKFLQCDLASIDGIERSETFVSLDMLKWSFKDFSPI